MSVTVQNDVCASVAALDALSHAGLKERYQALTGEAPPKRIGRALLKLAVAYEIQRKGHAAEIDRVRKKLMRFGADSASDVRSNLSKRRMNPGGRLVREWRGRTYEVYVADDGCYLEGERYASLSAIASAITGVKRNGPAFFGLRSSRFSS